MQNASDPAGSTKGELIALVIPVFNDWDSLSRLLLEIDAALGPADLRGKVVLVDDGSTVEIPDQLKSQSYIHLESVEVVRLLCNLGHQRAIAVGLAHIHKSYLALKCVVVMDADGQDRPQDIPRLVDELNSDEAKVVFAARSKRSEEYAFRVMYHLYRLVYLLLTGLSIRWGNFSAISKSALAAIVTQPDTWNHYAASVVRSRICYSAVSLPRGNRYLGESHMRYTSLVTHGLSGIAVFLEIVEVRLIVMLSGMIVVLSGVLGIAVVEFFKTLDVCFLWLSVAVSILMTFSGLGLLITLLAVLSLLGRRSQPEIIPSKVAKSFVGSVIEF